MHASNALHALIQCKFKYVFNDCLKVSSRITQLVNH